MDTPLAPPVVQNRRGKKHKIDYSPPAPDADFDRAVDLLLNDASLPPHLRTVMSHLLEIKEQFSVVIEINRELTIENERISKKNVELEKENSSLRLEVDRLKKALSSPPRSVPNQPMCNDKSPPGSFEEVERRRSIVIAGVPESHAALPSSRVMYDLNCVRQILDFLSIDSSPLCVYRMGRYSDQRPRLLKVVMPSSYFASSVIRRAPKLRSFSVQGIFIRPSIPKAERDRLRAERLLRSSRQTGIVTGTSTVVSDAHNALTVPTQNSVPNLQQQPCSENVSQNLGNM